MFLRRALAVAALAGLVLVGTASAGNYRIMFQGSEAVALESATAPRAAGYMGMAPVGGEGAACPTCPAGGPGGLSGALSGTCPTCVPGGTTSANFGAGVPNQIVTFLHPYTNQAVTIPLTLPVGRPNIIVRSDRIIYDYGLFAQRVIVRFHPDGRVEAIYRD